jgi:NAD kinase
MNPLTDRKIVLVTRPTRLAELVARFNTVSQAKFYIEHQGADFSDYLLEDEVYHRALVQAQAAITEVGRLQTIDRSFLPNFVFGPEVTVITLGQDGLVANTLKYLNDQPLVGVNPDPGRWDGRLLRFQAEDLAKVLPEVLRKQRPLRSVTMAEARLNNQQVMFAVNDLFIGLRTHGSARYLIRSGKRQEAQSSSGVIVSTGMGSTGWLKSLITGAAEITRSADWLLSQQAGLPATRPRAGTGRSTLDLAARSEFSWDANYLLFVVREPFPTRTTGASLAFGQVTSDHPLIIESKMAENGVIFSDGIEKDFLEFNSGTTASIGVAQRKGVLIQ